MGGVGGLLVENQDGNSYYPTYDGNGNVGEYLTAAGEVVAHFEYDPFGNTLVNTDSSNQFAYRFSSKPLNSETGLYYYGYRYYDSHSGRWPSKDPIEERGGINLYGFVFNQTNGLIDILGREPSDGGGGGGRGRGGKQNVKGEDPALNDSPTGEKGDKERNKAKRGNGTNPEPQGDPEPCPETRGEKAAREAREKAEAEARKYIDDNPGTTGQPVPSNPEPSHLSDDIIAGGILIGGLLLLPEITIPALIVGGLTVAAS